MNTIMKRRKSHHQEEKGPVKEENLLRNLIEGYTTTTEIETEKMMEVMKECHS